MRDEKITQVIAREILDSRGNPTIEVDVKLGNGIIGRAAVPSGASTGEHEALELRDGDKNRFNGKGVLKAVENIEKYIRPILIDQNVLEQRKNDNLMLKEDGTENKSKLGANAILGASLAMARAASNLLSIPLFRYLGGSNSHLLPVPMMNVINGGSHANNSIDIQEFMILPVKFDRFQDALRAGVEIFQNLKSVLQEKGLATTVGDEGGFAPNLESNETAIEIILMAIEKAGYEPGEDILLGLDCAASEFYNRDHGNYHLKAEDNPEKSTAELLEIYRDFCKKYPIISLEDGLDQNDWKGWETMTEMLGKQVQIVGDDLLVTNAKKLKQAIRDGIANSILIKVNQIGTLTETLDTVDIARSAGYSAIISHRSGETEDVIISHIAVATGCGQIKTGSLSRTDRNAKYNELLRIEEGLGNSAIYPGKSAFNNFQNVSG